MNDILGHDCDGREIYEFTILRAIWSNDINTYELKDADPRLYCALVADDGNVYAISVYDWWHKELIRKREKLNLYEDIPIIVKPISEMENYEIAFTGDKEMNYDLNRDNLKRELNSIIKSKDAKLLKKQKGKLK